MLADSLNPVIASREQLGLRKEFRFLGERLDPLRRDSQAKSLLPSSEHGAAEFSNFPPCDRTRGA